MALSNWDLMAVDGEGKSTNGVFAASSGVNVEIYKNWLYVSDEKAWQENCRYVKPVVMEIQEGMLFYKDISIVAFRGPQDGVFCVVWNNFYPEKKEGENKEPEAILTAMVGCGVYGYDERGEWIGVTKETLEFFVYTLKTGRGFENYVDDLPVELRNINFDNSVRFNQGNVYFAEAFSNDSLIQATKVGEAVPSLLQQWLVKKV